MSLAGKIDHTLLKPEAGRPEIHRVVAEAIEHGFASVCVNGAFVADVAKMLHGEPVKTCVVVGFPLGACEVAMKAEEAATAVRRGAEEIDFVAHLPFLLSGHEQAAYDEWRVVVKAARAVDPRVCVKVIIESALLMHGVSEAAGASRIQAACRAAARSGCDFVKTSTGFHAAGGATVEAVRMMKAHAGRMQVKASGGIRTRADADRMIAAGADRLGVSSGIAIVRGD